VLVDTVKAKEVVSVVLEAALLTVAVRMVPVAAVERAASVYALQLRPATPLPSPVKATEGYSLKVLAMPSGTVTAVASEKVAWLLRTRGVVSVDLSCMPSTAPVTTAFLTKYCVALRAVAVEPVWMHLR